MVACLVRYALEHHIVLVLLQLLLKLCKPRLQGRALAPQAWALQCYSTAEADLMKPDIPVWRLVSPAGSKHVTTLSINAMPDVSVLDAAALCTAVLQMTIACCFGRSST